MPAGPRRQADAAFASDLVLAPLLRRLLSLVYEALLLAALGVCAGVLFYAVEQTLALPHLRAAFQAYLVTLGGVYFVWQWVRAGETLPMKTWRLRLVTRDGARISFTRGSVRYIAALAGAAAFGIGFLWALVDRERQFLHDRIAGTRIVRA